MLDGKLCPGRRGLHRLDLSKRREEGLCVAEALDARAGCGVRTSWSPRRADAAERGSTRCYADLGVLVGVSAGEGALAPRFASRLDDRGGLLTCGDVERNPGPKPVAEEHYTLAGLRSRRNIAPQVVHVPSPEPGSEEPEVATPPSPSSSSASSEEAHQPARGAADGSDPPGDPPGPPVRSDDGKLPCPACGALVTEGRGGVPHVQSCHGSNPGAFANFFHPATRFVRCACGLIFFSAAQVMPTQCKQCQPQRPRHQHNVHVDVDADGVEPAGGPPEATVPMTWDEITDRVPEWPVHRFVPKRLREAVGGHLTRALRIGGEEGLKRLAVFPALVLYGQAADVARRAKWFSAGRFDELLDERSATPGQRNMAAEKSGLEVDDELGRLPLSTDVVTLPIEAAARVVELARAGALSRANAALSQASLASGDEALAGLKALHPHSPEPAIPAFTKAAPDVHARQVKAALKTFRLGSAAGPSGLAPDVVKSLASRFPDLLGALAGLVRLMVSTTLPEDACRFLFGAKVVALNKKGGGLRPIGCGDFLRRLSAKVLCGHSRETLREYLLGQRQVGVCVSGGVEAPPMILGRLVKEQREDWVAIKVDCANAFNTACRQAILNAVAKRAPTLLHYAVNAYGRHTTLFWGKERLVSAAGVQQGDPLGPAFFSLALGVALEGTAAATFECWYLDDGTFAAVASEALARFDVVVDCLATMSLKVNVRKCEIIALNPNSARPDTQLPWTDVEKLELLGVPCGTDTAAGAAKVVANVVRHLQILERLAQQDPHVAVVLARNCGGFAAINYLLRGIGPSLADPKSGIAVELMRQVDDAVEALVGTIVGRVDPHQRRQIFLPARLGGVGFRSVEGAAMCAHFAALIGAHPIVAKVCAPVLLDSADLRAAAKREYLPALPLHVAELASALVAEEVPRAAMQRGLNKVLDTAAEAELHAAVLALPVDPRREYARVLACTAKGASAYLTHPQVCGAWLAPRPFEITLQLRLGAEVGTGGKRCPNPGCAAVMDPKGAHALTCMKGGVRHSLHNAVRDYIATQASLGLMRPLREHMCFPGSQERMDVVLRTGFGGKEVLMDVAVTYPLRDDAVRNHCGPALAATQYQEVKWRNYGPQINSLTQVFVPTIADTFGGFGDQCRDTLSRVASAVAKADPGDFSSARSAFFGGLNRVLLTAVADLVLGALGLSQ